MDGSKRKILNEIPLNDDGNQKKKDDHQSIPEVAAAHHVFISGMGGVGAQVAKCLLLGNPTGGVVIKSITLQDDEEVDWWDLSGNPFFTEADLGKNRASICAEKLRHQIINNALCCAVDIHVFPSKLQAPYQLSTFQVVVFTDMTILNHHDAQQPLVKFNDYCRNHTPPIYFIMAQVNGLFGRVFCDFGPQFSCQILESNPLCRPGEDNCILTIKEDHPKFISLTRDHNPVSKEKFLWGMRPRPGNCNLRCGEDGGGSGSQGDRINNKSILLHFKPMKDSLGAEKPLIVGRPPADTSATDSSTEQKAPPALHFAFRALDKFIQQRGKLPAPGSLEDNLHFCSLASDMIMKEAPSVDAAKEWPVLHHFAKGSRAVLGPMASIFGGIAAHEVVKALSGISQPVFQLLYFDSSESLPSTACGGDSTLGCSRYVAQALVFGHEVQKKLEQVRLLVVGDGVLGCELMKNLALMGVASDANGQVTLTHRVPENSRISYAGRQNVFEDCYEGQCLPDVVTASSLSVNNNMNIRSLDHCLEQNFEHVYEDVFWKSLDTIIDVTNDRRSISQMSRVSQHFVRPFVITLISGTQCHSIAELPPSRRSHGALNKFPFQWRAPCHEQHLGWARSEFERLFVKTPKNVNGFLLERDGFLCNPSSYNDAQSRELLHRIIECLDLEWCQSFEDCIIWARMRFQVYFVDNIYNIMSQNSVQGKKRASIQKIPVHSPPMEPLVFSASDEDHHNFVKVASILRAKTFGIKLPNCVDWVKEVERVQELSRERDVKALVTTPIHSLVIRAAELVENLPLGFQMKPIPFDVDDNHHMEFTTSMFNLLTFSETYFKLSEERAKSILRRCYPLPFASTCTVAAGLTCLKLYKLIGGGTDEGKDLQNVESNLGSPGLLKSAAIEEAAIKEAYHRKNGQNVHKLMESLGMKEKMLESSAENWNGTERRNQCINVQF